ncbi:hypothetical protein M2454_002688 [Aequitasia blattaphilus]|uniref:DUF3881 family protein n=1 Tax=Aequitasia blattaphilus TaxID=2949332 RepID=A0ABT1EBU9_9FIRM|nr:DUF3881 family protein [Aequitasia blattaphilus]MCP1103119.1 DUF3881 family protein [Aequitasia blattaphilus]MCR8615759.1 DUF3881 family protein [Aequitasia blattaphilus]
MHKYFKAIGFEDVKSKQEEDIIIEDVKYDYTHHELVGIDEVWDFCEFQKEYGPGIGVSVCGYMNESEYFEKEYEYPFFLGTGITSYSEVLVEKRIDRNDYVGICEDLNVGVSLVFKLQNTLELLREKQKKKQEVKYRSVTLSGLCNAGTILFPIMKSEAQKKQINEEKKNRMMLINEAKSGDQRAIESLTLDDIDTYSQVSRRIIHEDVFSIVDSYIMPFGIESDIYSILGEIKQLTKVENELSKEEIYLLSLEVNDLKFDVCVPVSSIIGEPEVGRRFKGNVWLQGYIHFR